MAETVEQRIIISGFGGQGILFAGKLLAYAGMLEGKNVAWLPSYGPEMRGGAANCHVTISDSAVASPVLNSATTLIAMSDIAFDKFKDIVAPGGAIIVDSSMVSKKTDRTDITQTGVEATRLASQVKSEAFANMVMLGKLISSVGVVSKQSIIDALNSVLPESKHHLIPLELQALEAGERN